MINNAERVSGEQQRDSSVHMHVSILPQTPLPIQIKCLLIAVFAVSTHLPTLVSGGALGQPPTSTPVSLPTRPHPTPPTLLLRNPVATSDLALV